MLSVSPPLHKDFRGRRALCSPGDGWRSYVPPPLPTLQPAFHFLSPLLEQAVYVPVPVAPTPRIPMDASLNGSLERMMSLPLEVLDLIAAYVNEADAGPSLALASRFFNRLTMRHLLQDVQLTSHQSVVLLSRTLEEHPSLGQHIRRLSILVERPRWEQMDALAAALGRYARCVVHLHLRFPSSDLHTAMTFLSNFSPESFDWVSDMVQVC